MQLGLRPKILRCPRLRGDGPGLPATKRGVNACRPRALEDQRTLARRRAAARGRRLRIPPDLLPLASRLTYVAMSFASSRRPDRAVPRRRCLQAREARDARIVAVRLADAFRRSTGSAARFGRRLFCRLFNAGSIEVPAAARKPRTMSVRRWRAARRAARTPRGWASSGDGAHGHRPARHRHRRRGQGLCPRPPRQAADLTAKHVRISAAPNSARGRRRTAS